jgi:Domain of unknown function (DUF4352)
VTRHGLCLYERERGEQHTVPAQRENTTMHRFAVSVLIPAIALVGCGSSSSSGTHQPSKVKQPVSKTGAVTGNARSLRNHFTDGATGVTATVDRLGLKTQAARMKPAPKGFVWALVHVSLHNGGKSSHTFTISDFLMTSKNNQIIQPQPLPSSAAKLRTGTLKPGETRGGTIAYQVRKGIPLVTLTWSDNNQLSPPARLLTVDLSSA